MYCFIFLLFSLFNVLHRAEIVRWVTESKRPFQIVKDCGFQTLMKTGRPTYQIPSPDTVLCDVKTVFMKVCKRIAKILQVGISFNIQPKIDELLTWSKSRSTVVP